MASTLAKVQRRVDALGRLSAALNVSEADLHTHARGDRELALVITLERIADAVDAKLGTTRSTKKAEPDREPLKEVEKELEAETGHDVVKTGDEPPTFVETDKPAPRGKK